MQITKAAGTAESFDAEKLHTSLIQSGVPREHALYVCETVQSKIKPGESTSNIFRSALRMLVRDNLHLAVQYNLRHGIDLLGPAGFIFEQYVEALMRAYGYVTKRNQYVQGECVEHEIDVVAEQGELTYLIEAKYRNDRGGKTHVDTVMYSDARIMDIARKCINEGSRCNYKLWLITNAKFTGNAIKYGECRNLTLTSWNYPKKGNLLDLIIEKKLYPVTVFPSVTQEARERFARFGMLLAQDLVPYTADDLHKHFDIPTHTAEAIVAEVREILVV